MTDEIDRISAEMESMRSDAGTRADRASEARGPAVPQEPKATPPPGPRRMRPPSQRPGQHGHHP